MLEAKDALKQIALQIFGTDDGIKPIMPRRGEKIQEAMEAAFKAGQKQQQVEDTKYYAEKMAEAIERVREESHKAGYEEALKERRR